MPMKSQPMSNTFRDATREIVPAADERRLINWCCNFSGGFMANSLAVMNDALHQVFDLSSLLMSLVASWIARWKPTENKTFGYYRAGTNI